MTPPEELSIFLGDLPLKAAVRVCGDAIRQFNQEYNRQDLEFHYDRWRGGWVVYRVARQKSLDWLN